jgi:type IV pilus assembly protein PilM
VLRTLLRGKNHKLHISISDFFMKFLESGGENKFYQFGQKCLPRKLVVDGIIQDPEELGFMLGAWADEYKLAGSKVSFCLPDQQAVIRKVAVPQEIPLEEVNGYLYRQLGQTIHLPFEDPAIESVPVGENIENRSVLLFASRESILENYIKVFKEAKLKPMWADLGNLSLYRLYYNLDLSRRNERLLMLDIQYTTVQITIFENHAPVYTRNLVISEEFDSEVTRSRSGRENLIVTEASSYWDYQFSNISKEVERILNFYKFTLSTGKEEINKILIAGDNPYLSEHGEKLREQSELECVILDAPLFRTTNNRSIPMSYSVPLGLSLKQVL